MNMNQGALLFARYSFMPNRLGYCGGQQYEELLQYCVAQESDPGLTDLLVQFQGAYPYMQFIAHANGIKDAFDKRVIEAYWLGNSLLENVNPVNFYRFLTERFSPQLSRKALEYVTAKPQVGALPHHSFHVFDVHSRLGMLGPALEVMDKCRISWGSVVSVEDGHALVNTRPLTLRGNKLALGEPEIKSAAYRIDGTGYLLQPKPGEIVSLHWDWVCDQLSSQQAADLERFTRRHLALANATLSTIA